MDKEKNDKNKEDNEQVIVRQQQQQQREQEQQTPNDVTLVTDRNKETAHSGSGNDDMREEKSNDNSSSKASPESNINDPLGNKSEAKENSSHGNSNEEVASQITTPAQWAKNHGIPVAWLKAFATFDAIADRYEDSNTFIQHIREEFGVTLPFDQNATIGNLFIELRQYRDIDLKAELKDGM